MRATSKSVTCVTCVTDRMAKPNLAVTDRHATVTVCVTDHGLRYRPSRRDRLYRAKCDGVTQMTVVLEPRS